MRFPVEKHPMPGATSQAVRQRAGARGFSGYVSDAVARQLQRDALDDALARMGAAHGPVDEAEVARIMALLAE